VLEFFPKEKLHLALRPFALSQQPLNTPENIAG
jgi:hypothetical protein